MWKIAILCMVIALPAVAQTTRFYSPSGNPEGYIRREGNRDVFRDNSGNARGYWQREGGDLVHRDNSGNLLGREKTTR